MESTAHVVTGRHNGWSFPWLVADHVNQYEWLVDALLREEGPAETVFYVWHKPVAMRDSHKEGPAVCLRVGYHDGFGAAFFRDESTPVGEDWAWIADSPDPVADPPTIFYDLPIPVIFPPAAVMPVARLREVIMEWCRTGLRPTSVAWETVNSQVWDLDEDGRILPEPARPRRTMHTMVGGRVVREWGWGTDRTAPTREPERDETWVDHKTGRTAFGTLSPED